ncbi:MAG: hypothetical protein JWP24_1958, partial [Marmoricola sp.]|nr:hypothetical protein [Marmoricola sp.]
MFYSLGRKSGTQDREVGRTEPDQNPKTNTSAEVVRV